MSNTQTVKTVVNEPAGGLVLKSDPTPLWVSFGFPRKREGDLKALLKGLPGCLGLWYNPKAPEQANVTFPLMEEETPEGRLAQRVMLERMLVNDRGLRPLWTVVKDGTRQGTKVLYGLKYPEALAYLLPERAAKQVFGKTPDGRRAYKGGYACLPCLKDESLRVVTVPVPPRMSRRLQETQYGPAQKPWLVFGRGLRRLLRDREPTIGYAVAGKIMLIYKGSAGWMQDLGGIKVMADGSEQKRLKCFAPAPFVLGEKSTGAIKVELIKLTDGELLGGTSKATTRSLLDGCLSVDSGLVRAMIKEAARREPEGPTDRETELLARELAGRFKGCKVPYTKDDLRAMAWRQLLENWERSKKNWERYIEQARGCKTFTFRAICPEGGGFLKGLAYSVDGLHGRTGAHILTSNENLKKQVSGGEGWQITMTPQVSDGSEARCSVQAIVAHPQLFTPKVRKLMVDRSAIKILWEMRNKQFDKELRLEAAYAQELKDNSDVPPMDEDERELMEEQGNFIRDTLRDGARWVAEGHEVLESYTLFDRIVKAKLGAIVMDGKEKSESTKPTEKELAKGPRMGYAIKLNFELPCSQSRFVISDAVVRNLLLIPTDRFARPAMGEIAFLKEYGVFVVSDERWLEMLQSHGGCDLDDKFQVVLCRDKAQYGRPRVFIWRNPSSRGEYTILDPRMTDLANDVYPRSDGYIVSGEKNTPVKVLGYHEAIDVDFSKLPARMSELLAGGKVKVAGLGKVEKGKPEEYQGEHLMAAIHRAAFAPPVGLVMNAYMLYDQCTMDTGNRDYSRGGYPVIRALPEDYIDFATKCATEEYTEVYQEAAERRVMAALKANGGKVDRVLWQYKAFQAPNDCRVETDDNGPIAQMLDWWKAWKLWILGTKSKNPDECKPGAAEAYFRTPGVGRCPVREKECEEIRKGDLYAECLGAIRSIRSQHWEIRQNPNLKTKEAQDAAHEKVKARMVLWLYSHGERREECAKALVVASWDYVSRGGVRHEGETWYRGVFEVVLRALR